MGYFSNGTEGDMYEERYCSNCRHSVDDPDKPGCPVMLCHVLFAYEECNNKSNAATMLELLIPREGAFNGKCKMHSPKQARKEPKRRVRLPGI